MAGILPFFCAANLLWLIGSLSDDRMLSFHQVVFQPFLMKYLLLILFFIPVVAAADQDDDFLAAREAYRAGNDVRLAQIAEGFKSSPLEPYLTYYQLRLRLYSRNPLGLKEFLDRPDNTPVIDQLRSEWLKWQAKQQNWGEFAAGISASTGSR